MVSCFFKQPFLKMVHQQFLLQFLRDDFFKTQKKSGFFFFFCHQLVPPVKRCFFALFLGVLVRKSSHFKLFFLTKKVCFLALLPYNMYFKIDFFLLFFPVLPYNMYLRSHFFVLFSENNRLIWWDWRIFVWCLIKIRRFESNNV